MLPIKKTARASPVFFCAKLVPVMVDANMAGKRARVLSMSHSLKRIGVRPAI